MLPSNVGGDLVRIHLHGKITGERSLCAAAVFMERYTGIVMLLLLAVVVEWFQDRISVPLLETALIASLAGLCFITWVILDARVANLIQRVTIRWIPAADNMFGKISRFRENVQLYLKAPAGMLLAMILSFAFYCLAILYIWVVVKSFDETVPLAILIVQCR